MRISVAVAAVATSHLFACTATVSGVSSGFLPTAPPPPAVAPEHVELVFGGHASKPYEEHGVATIVGGYWGSPPPVGVKRVDSLSIDVLVAELRLVAASKGCDALLVNPEVPNRNGMMLTATCIVYTTPAVLTSAAGHEASAAEPAGAPARPQLSPGSGSATSR